MSSTAGRVTRVPGAKLPYVVTLMHHLSDATKHSFRSMREAEAFIKRNTPVPGAVFSTTYDRPAPALGASPTGTEDIMNDERILARLKVNCVPPAPPNCPETIAMPPEKETCVICSPQHPSRCDSYRANTPGPRSSAELSSTCSRSEGNKQRRTNDNAALRFQRGDVVLGCEEGMSFAGLAATYSPRA